MESKCRADVLTERMRDKPCYMPALPRYDICQNMNSRVVKRLDCRECIEERGISEPVEPSTQVVKIP